MKYFKPCITVIIALCTCLLCWPLAHAVQAAGTTATACKGWHLVSSPSVESEATLRSIAAVSSTDIWAVGYQPVQGSSSQPLVLHRDGSAWSLVSVPSPSSFPTGLYGVAAISSHDVWTVGFYVDEKTRNTLTLTEHWDGTKWSIVPSPNPSTMANNAIEDSLYSVYALASNNVWAVGSFDGLYEPLVEHWNGTKWSVIHSPNPAPYDGNSAFQGTGGSAANDLWAVGEQNNGHYDVSLIEHWNGTKWKVIPNPGTGLPSFNGLYSVSATSSTDAWAVGYQEGTTENNTLIEHWNGQKWRIVASPKVTLGPGTLYSVVALSTTDAWAVGSVSDNGAPLLIEHWNGTRWTLALGLAHQPVGGVAYATTMVSGKLWVVGEDYNSTSQVLTGYFCS